MTVTHFHGFHYLGVAGLLLYSVKITVDFLRRQTSIDQESSAAAYLRFGLAVGAIYAAITILFPASIRLDPAFGELDLHHHLDFSFVVLTPVRIGDDGQEIAFSNPTAPSLRIGPGWKESNLVAASCKGALLGIQHDGKTLRRRKWTGFIRPDVWCEEITGAIGEGLIDPIEAGQLSGQLLASRLKNSTQ